MTGESRWPPDVDARSGRNRIHFSLQPRLQRELDQRKRLDARLANRPRKRVDLDDVGVPHLDAYAKACMQGEVVIGRMYVTKSGRAEGPGWIVNFPTKEDWRNPSNVEYIETGLTDLIHVIERLKIHSIALPPLGCWLGGLDWAQRPDGSRLLSCGRTGNTVVLRKR